MVKQKNGKTFLKNATAINDSYVLIYEDAFGRIFSGQNSVGIDVFNFRKDTLHLIKRIQADGYINGFYEDLDRKTLWISSFSGLIKVDLDSLKVDTVFTEKDGLPDKNIHAMLADDEGNLWLGTPKGLTVYQRKDGRLRQFSLADGTQSTEFLLMAGAKRRNGELWFGGSNGITIVPAGRVDSIKTKSVVKITAITINDEDPVDLRDEETGATNITQIHHISLPYSQNTVSFEFVAIDYSDPANNRLRYKLEGEDDSWVELKKGEPAFTRYSNLWSRNYTFWLQSANSDGVWSEPIEAIKLTIRAPFWARWEFIAAVVIALAAITWLLIRYRISQIREKAELNTRVAENKMAALRSQMNPHFVFNSLQTVNVFITKQDLRGAIEYVNQFARLMRVILENSRVNVIPLDNEIELLELYLKIESRRFSQPFTYSITVGNDLDTFSTEIPPMLLQPFVENAIKHGLFHKKNRAYFHHFPPGKW
ncbi:MAG: histidine kinase [Saprospiraceae bacterium]|nr:histidine kinase [Saprospiraceae bacterium]